VGLSEIITDENELKIVQEFLQPTNDERVRWVNYLPQRAVLEFESWEKDAWTERKKYLSKKKNIILHRQVQADTHFFTTFLGLPRISQENFIFKQNSPWKISIPEACPSQKSEAFIPFVANLIQEEWAKIAPENNLSVRVSSLETLRNLALELGNNNFPGKILGEKLAGGDGKLLEKLNDNEPVVLLSKNLESSLILQKKWQKVFVPKFYFGVPHPLFEYWGNIFKAQNINWWDTWVVPQSTASLSRSLASFDCSEIIFLDSRGNSSWGKNVLAGVK
jgi:hypothetical protein